MKRCFLMIVFFVACGSAWASEDYVKVRYLPRYDMSDYVTEVIIKDAPDGSNVVIPDAYKKLKELEKSGRLDYVVVDAGSITIEVHYRGEVIKSSISLGLSDSSSGFVNFSRLWNEAYDIVWKSIENKLKPGRAGPPSSKTSVPADQAPFEE